MKKKILISLLPALLSLPALAEETPPYDSWVLRLGGNYVFNGETFLNINRADGVIGTTVDTERDLDTNDATWTWRADLAWRFAPNHTLELGYYNFELDGSKDLSREIVVRNQTFTVGSAVDTNLEFEVMRLEYIYSFYRNEKVDLGVGAGIYAVGSDLTIAARGIGQQESADVTAPLPVAGFRMQYRATPKVDVIAAYDVFFINQNDYSGSMSDFRVLLEHRTTKHLGFGIGLDHFALNAQLSDDEWDGAVATNWNGAMVYLVLR